MAKAWKMVLVGVFAEDYLIDIAKDKFQDPVVWRKGGKITLGNVEDKDNKVNKVEKLETDKVEKLETEWGKYKILPFFVCETIEDFRKGGLKCPYEFVIERKDLLTANVNSLKERIEVLQNLPQTKEGIDLATFRDWMSGVMRRYMFLDDTAHGSSGYIDPEDPKWDWEDEKIKGRWVIKIIKKPDDKNDQFKYATHGQWLKERFSSSSTFGNEHDSLGHLKPLMRVLWPDYFDDGRLSLSMDDSALNEKIERLKAVYNNEKDNPLPLSQGDRARFVTPTGKINILLIDDDAMESVLSSSSHRDNEEEWKQFDNTFVVQPFKLTPEDFPNLEDRLNDILNKHLSYDLALVDLCFGEEPGQDPLGYHVIRKLSKLFPHMPIVVYSRYKDMGHIMRAFQCGARWFLQKGEEQKLARHLLDVVKKGNWKREWRAMQDYYPVQFVYNGKDPSFDDKFKHTDEWQYLTAKSMEFFPGKFIEVKKMGGGISTASTFSVQKGLKLDGQALQSPVIIKIDTTPNTRMEYERYFRYIKPYIANESGRIEKPCIVIERNCSAIVYTFAGRQDDAHALDSMKSMLKEDIVFKASCDYEKYRKAFDMIFDEILPRIHRVTPNREFGDGDKNRHQEVFSKPTALDAQESKGASFPNLQFGEVKKEDFYQTYLIRYPHFGRKRIGIKAFAQQPELRGKSNQKLHPYEFHDVGENDAGGIDLEVYDLGKNGDRKPYLLTGPIATHVAKFRQQLYPGTTLWVKGDEDDNELTKDALFEKRVGSEEDNISWKNYVWSYIQPDYDGLRTCGQIYFNLVEKVLHFCKALYGTATENELSTFLCRPQSGESLFKPDEAKKFFSNIAKRFQCPIAICHGDLNYGNIMLESRKHPPKEEAPDISQTVTDAWLIDFARTRRDLIAHDFNVMFTDTFALMFDTQLFKDAELAYDEKVRRVLPRFIRDVMFAKNQNPPDYLEGDARLEFVYKILRRIRKAALDAGVSIEMYTLTTVLECLMALKLHLKKSMKNLRASAALFAVAKICFDRLCNDVELDLLSMGLDGKTNKEREVENDA